MFDYVGLGIHIGFKMTSEQATERYLKAMDNKHVLFVAHPSCRLIGHREPFDFNIEKILDKAKERDVYMEINSFPDRLDLNDLHVKLGKDRGVKFVISTDAHYIKHLNYMKYGIATARRGWLEKSDVLNTQGIKDIEKKLGL